MTRTTALARCSAVLVITLVSESLAAAPRSFPTPDAAVNALATAVRAGDKAQLLSILGTDGRSLITSGDAVADKEAGRVFIEKFDRSHSLTTEGDARATLVVGEDRWPFPIPVVKKAAGWAFDTAAGKDEILARRVGQNELDAIQVCLAYVDAQREYRELNPEGSAPAHYARLLVSSPGKRDGLYWPATDGAPESPLGPRVGGLAGEGYQFQSGKLAPYHGYFYRILTAQGRHAQGGAINYLVNGKLYGGFAIVAWPARYGDSGIMTFLVNHDGVVLQKDLGKDSGSLAKAMSRYDPDSSWSAAK